MAHINTRKESEGEWKYLSKTIYGWQGQLWTGQYSHCGGQSIIKLTPLSEADKNALRKIGVLKSYLQETG